MNINSLTVAPPERKTVLAAGLFGYTESAPLIARNETIDVKRFVALYGEPALESLLSSKR